MRVFLSGYTGFIGKKILRDLDSFNFNVVLMGRRNISSLNSNYNFIEWDILKNNDLDKDIFKFKEDDIFVHLSWPALNDFYSSIHIEHISSHISNLKKLIKFGLKNIIVSGTCLEYGKREGGLSVVDQPHPKLPYAIAKNLIREKLVELQSDYFFNLQWIRIFYVLHPDPVKKNLLYQLECAIKEGRESFKMSHGYQKRDYVTLDDISSCFLRAINDHSQSRILNCCSGNPITVKSLVDKWIKKSQSDIRLDCGYYPIPDYEPLSFWGIK